MSIAAGESVSWYRGYGDFTPSDGYTLKYYVRGKSAFEITCTDDSGQWLAEIAPGGTADAEAGTYKWFAYAEQGTEGEADFERWPVASGVIEVTANPFTAEAGDFQAHPERVLGMLEAVIEGRVTADVQAFTIGGRAITQIPVKELLQMRGIYAGLVWRTQNPDAIAPEGKVVFGG